MRLRDEDCHVQTVLCSFQRFVNIIHSNNADWSIAQSHELQQSDDRQELNSDPCQLLVLLLCINNSG